MPQMTLCNTGVYAIYLPGLCVAFFVLFFYHHRNKELVYSVGMEA